LGAGAATAFGISEMLSPIASAATGQGRAVVCIYLMGGNDSNNMIVPLDSPAYNRYSQARGALAISRDALLGVTNGASGNYGFHPQLPGLQDLYNRYALAVLANVGRLDAPLTKAQVAAAPPAESFYRHTEAVQLNYMGGDFLAIPWAVQDAARVVRMEAGVTVASPDAASSRTRDLVHAASATPPPDGFPDTGFGRKLGRVLQALRTSSMRQAAFVVPIVGFDTHDNQLDRQARAFATLDAGLVAFYRALQDNGLAQSVTVYTDTEFNRTMLPNRQNGTGHAWGGHQLILGGATLGGRIYGQFPSMEMGGADDAVGNGTWIPTTSHLQYAATLASWYGEGSPARLPGLAGLSNFAQTRLDFLAG
jgi:uncharacterized protein (DUF1501 family)